MPRYDWGAIREEYVTGTDDVTNLSLAKKYGCARETLSRRCSSESWLEQRSQYRHQVITKSRTKASTKEAEIRVRHLDIGRKMNNVAVDILDTPQDLEQIRYKLADDPSELRLFIANACEIERKAGGIPDTIELERIVEGKVASEVESFVAMLESKLSPEVLQQVLDALHN